MSDRNFEEWLEGQMPDAPSPEIDAKILAEGRALLAQRPDQRAMSSVRWLALAAAAVVAVTGGWLLGPWRERSDDPRAVQVVLAAAGNGSYQLTPGTSYESDPLSSWLLLKAGTCTAHAVDVPLETAFPGGLLRITQGQGSVQLITEKEAVVEMSKKQWRRGSVVVALTLALGWGVVEFSGGSEPSEAQPLEVGEKRVLLVTPDAEQPGQFAVEEVLARGDVDGAAEPRTGSEGTATDAAVTQDETAAPTYRGQVVDGATGEPIAGVRVGWAVEWIGGSDGMMVASPQSKVFVGHPTSLVIGEELIQLPFWLSPDLELRVAAVTDAEGFYDLPREPKTPAEVLVFLGEEYQTGFEHEVPAEDATGADAVLVTRLYKARVIVGQVVAANGAPLRGEAFRASLKLAFDLPGHKGWSASRAVLLDDDFSFEVSVGGVDQVTLTLEAASYEAYEQRFDVRPGENSVALALVDHAYLAGRVTDEDGTPLHGVNILAKSGKRGFFRDSMNYFSGGTNANGEYLVTIYGPDIEITAEMEEYEGVEFKKVDGSKPFDFVLRPTSPGSMAGRVVDSRGNPIENAHVNLIRGGVATMRVYRLRTDARGEFSFDDLAPGKYRVTAQPHMDDARASDAVFPEAIRVAYVAVEVGDIQVKGATETRDVELVIADGATVFGVFRDTDGAPKADERIALYRPDLTGGDHQRVASVVTDEAGEFLFRGVPSGTFAVYAESLGNYKMVQVRGTKEHVVEIGGETSIFRGRIYRGSTPVASAAVAIGRLEEGGGLDTRIGRTDAEGRFEFDGVARGRYVLHVRDAATETVLLDVIVVARDERELIVDWPATVVTIDVSDNPVPPETELTLELVSVPGIPLAGLVPAAYLQIARAVTTDGSTFRFVGISPGEYRATLQGVTPPRSVDVRVEGRDLQVPLP